MMPLAESAEGTLVVMVCRARHLPNRRKLDKQSPYVLLRVNAVAKKTPAHFRAGQTPEWTHAIRFQLARDRRAVMRLDVLDETRSDPTPIGGTEIDCSAVFLNPANLQPSGKYILDGWHDLECKGKYAGKIFLEMTFYPSAPVLPPKVADDQLAGVGLPETAPIGENPDVFRHSAPASTVPEPGHDPDDIFVSGPPKKSSFFRSSNPEPRAKDTTVFTEGTRPKTSRFSKFKDKFLAREPITELWAGDARERPSDAESENGHFSASAGPLSHAPSPLDNLDDLSLQLGIHQAPMQEYVPQNLGTLGSAPPPPPHSVAGSAATDSYLHRRSFHDAKVSPSRSPEHKHASYKSAPSSPSKTRRKPPPGAPETKDLPPLDTTKIPFSADAFQLDAVHGDVLPTKVFHMDRPVKSLTVQAAGHSNRELNPDEIDPRYYAPTPSEHVSRNPRLQSSSQRFEDSARDSGYLGEGEWKFSPSVFQRINCDNAAVENKPPVPPKIPSGLSEREYYVLDKDSYLKDVNGRRF